jgi:hypothetical protein
MPDIIKGKRIAIGIIVLLLVIDIAVTMATSSMYAANGELGIASYKLLQGIFRFILTGVILYFFYKGHGWAKWLMAILLILGGLIALLSQVQDFEIISLLFAIVYLGVGSMMILSRSVRDFLNYQKGRKVAIEGLESNNIEIKENE